MCLLIHTGRVITMAKAVRCLKPSQSEFQKLFSTLCGSRSDWQVWSDFITMSATAISNAFDREGQTHDDRERQYMELSRAYTKDELDILARLLSIVVLALDGTVTLSKYNGSYGYCVMIDHGNGLTTLYGHNSRLLVSVGQTVHAGDVISLSGATGRVTGPHLHFEVRVNGERTNPRYYLP